MTVKELEDFMYKQRTKYGLKPYLKRSKGKLKIMYDL